MRASTWYIDALNWRRSESGTPAKTRPRPSFKMATSVAVSAVLMPAPATAASIKSTSVTIRSSSR